MHQISVFEYFSYKMKQKTGPDPFLISRRLISCWQRELLSVRTSISSRHPPGPRASIVCWVAGLAFSCRAKREYMNLVRMCGNIPTTKTLYVAFPSFVCEIVSSTYRTLDCSLYGHFGHVLASALLQYVG